MNASLIDRLAEKVATSCNGGGWFTHYTETQRQLWRNRVIAMLDLKETSS